MPTKRHFPDWIKAYCDTLEGKTEAPRRFHLWSAVSCLAGALTRRVMLDEVTYRYYPNFYVLLVSPPGVVKKTSTIDLAHELLRRLEETGDADHVHIAPDMTTVEGLTNYLASINQNTISNNGTGILNTTWTAQCACTFSIGEFGSLYRSDNTSLINLLTELFDCRNVALWKHTKTQGDDVIVNPFVNLIAGTTPKFLQDEFDEKVGGWGLSSRIIFVFAQRKEQAVYRPSKLLNSDEYRMTREWLYEDLKHISQLAGSFEFTDEADKYSEQWYLRSAQEAEEYVNQDDYSEWTAHFKSRKQVHVHKLAMVLSCARRDNLLIERVDIQDAVNYVDSVERDLPKAFERKLSQSKTAHTEQAVIDRVLALLLEGPKPRNEIVNEVSKLVDSITVRRVIDSAIARNLLTNEVRGMTGSWLVNGHVKKN